MFAERNHWSHTKPQSSPTPDGGIGFGKGLLENYSSQHSRTLNNCTGGSSSHGDGPRGDELGGSEISDEVFSISGEKTTTQQGELDLIPADFGTLDDRQELQGEDKPADDFSELPALDQALSSSGNREDGTNVTKKSTPDKSYVPSSGYGSPRLTGKRKLARSMRGLSPINTRSRTRLGYIGDKNSSPTNPTQAEQARESGTESSRKKKPAASHKRVAKKPFGSGKNGPGSDVLRNQPATKFGASQVRGSKPESPDNVSSASSNRRQYTDCKDAASSDTSGKAPDMSIYDVEGSPEPEKPAPRKTAAKGRSKKRAAPAPTTSSQVQPAKEVSNQKFQAPAGSKSQAKIQENRKPKPFQTYGRAVAEDVIDESSPEWITIPNSKRRRSHTGQETTDRPLKKVKAEDGTKALPGQDEQASSASGKVHIVSSDDGDDGGGVAECEGVFNAGLNPDLPRTQCRVVNPVELGISPQGEFTQRITTHGAIQWASAKGRRPSKLAVTSGQEQNDVARSTADLGDMRAPLPLQVVSHLPTSRPHSSITKGTSTKPMSTASKSERVPCIGLDRSNRIAPLFSGQNEQYLGALHPNTAGQQDDHQSSPYSLHPRSMAFHQKLSSMQDARENGFSGSKDTDIAQPQAARGQNSSRTEAHDDPLEEKNRWQAAVDETSQGLADTMHAITGVGSLQLTYSHLSRPLTLYHRPFSAN